MTAPVSTYDFEIVEDEFQANTYEAGDQFTPDVLGLSDGGYVVSYNSGPGAGFDIRLDFYDASGQLLTSTFMDYLKPTALDVPDIDVGRLEHPSPFTPLGAKGVGEGGAIPGPAAVADAIEDALASHGVTVRGLPVTPEMVWRWLYPERRA